MAIVKAQNIKFIKIIYEGADPQIMFHVEHSVDDDEDPELPLIELRSVQLDRYTISEDDDGNEVKTPNDIKSQPQVIQDIAAVIWT